MIADFEALACKAKQNIAGLFQIIGDAGTTERSHLIGLQGNHSEQKQDTKQARRIDAKKAGKQG